MSITTQGIVHKLNELIAEAETFSQTIAMQEVMPACITLVVINHYKRAIGQLKAARTSLVATGNMGGIA